MFRVSVPKQTLCSRFITSHHRFKSACFFLHAALRHVVVFGPSPPASALGLSLLHRRYYIQKWLAACRTPEPTVKVRASGPPTMKNNPRKVRGGGPSLVANQYSRAVNPGPSSQRARPIPSPSESSPDWLIPFHPSVDKIKCIAI